MAEVKPIQVTDIVGDNGRYQMAALLVAILGNALLGAFQVYAELEAPDVELYWNWEADDPNRTIFRSTDCKMADLNEYAVSHNHSQSSSTLIYKSKYSDNTLTEQLDLICEKSWLVSLSKSAGTVGIFCGSIVSGYFSERFGRRPAVIFQTAVAVVANVCILFQRNLVLFFIGSFLFGSTALPLSQSLAIQAMEVFPTSVRSSCSTISRYGGMIGQLLMVGVLWLCKDWFYTQLVLTILALATLISTLYVLESPVWLVVRGKTAEAKKNLLIIIRRNKMNERDAEEKIDLWLQQMKASSEIGSQSEKGSIGDLFKNGIIARYTVLNCFVRLSCLFIYLGITFNVQSFGSNLYEEMSISSALSIVLCFVTIVLLSKISVRVITIVFSLLFVLTCVVYCITIENSTSRSILSLLSRLFISAAQYTCFVYQTEVFPTSVRVIAGSVASAACSIFSPLSPFTKELGELTTPYTPFVLFGSLSLLSVVCLKILPETRGKALKHTVAELKESRQSKRNVFSISSNNI